MKLIRVAGLPGRRVLHPVTHRIIGATGILVDRNDLTFIRLVADGDLEVITDEVAAAREAEALAAAAAAEAEDDAPEEAMSAPSASPDKE